MLESPTAPLFFVLANSAEGQHGPHEIIVSLQDCPSRWRSLRKLVICVRDRRELRSAYPSSMRTTWCALRGARRTRGLWRFGSGCWRGRPHQLP